MNRWVLLNLGLFATWIFGQNLGLITLVLGLASLGFAVYYWEDK